MLRATLTSPALLTFAGTRRPDTSGEAALNLSDERPCIPEAGRRECDQSRQALWNGDSDAWTRKGISDPDARFRATIELRQRAGDPVTNASMARWGGVPYVKITRVRFHGRLDQQADEFVEITNLGGGSQELTGWAIRAPEPVRRPGGRRVVIPTGAPTARFPAGLILQPGQSCRVYAGRQEMDGCGTAQFLPSGLGPDDSQLPDDEGRIILFVEAEARAVDDTLYRAAPHDQPPPPNLQLVDS